MEWLFIFGLLAAVARLAGCLRSAERRIGQVQDMQAYLLGELRAARQPAAAAEPDRTPADVEPLGDAGAGPVRIRASVPKVVARRADDPGESVSAPAALEAPEPIAIAEEPALKRLPFRLDLEDIFGRHLPIWAGGVALAVAGVFLVRYSIERGLITPLLRVLMAFVFGFGLIAAAEAAHRLRERVADPRVGQALAGAGLATLYAAFYLAGTQYGLIGQTLAFLGLAAVTAGAIALSFRFGLPSAVLGLVGGFAAPALVGGEDANLPLLSLYLGLVTAGLVLSARRQECPWMGVTALVGGLGWGAVLLLSGGFGFAEAFALGLYFILLGAVLPALAGAHALKRVLRLTAAAMASVQLALLVDQAGYSPLVWALYLLLGTALAFFGWRKPEIRAGNAIAVAVALVLLALWDGAAGPLFAAVAAGIVVVFTVIPLALMRRGQDRDLDGWQLAAVAAGLGVVTYASFGAYPADRVEAVLALSTLALAVLPAAGAWLMRARADAAGFAIQLAAAAALVFAALLMVTPGWAAPLAGAAVFAVLLALLRGRVEPPLHALLWGAAIVAGLALALFGQSGQEAEHLFGSSQDTRGPLALLRWLALAAVLAALAWRERVGELRRLAEGAAAIAVYGALAQVLPRETLAWTAALLAIAIQFGLRPRMAARLIAVTIAAAWALEPLGRWLAAGLESLTADPVFASDLPGMWIVATRLLPLLAAALLVRLPVPETLANRVPVRSLALSIGIVIAHILFKQVFAIESATRFVRLGLAERTLWEALLLGAASAAARSLPGRGAQIAIAFGAAALAHFALYTGLLHNPLRAAQALGPLPLANLATASYGVAIGAALLLRRWMPARRAPAADGAVMGLACLAALTLLRQAFAGSFPALQPIGQTEDLLRSLAGILLALAFLWLGGRRNERSWRAGSLAIMLVAVAKVFVIDAAGLDGLLRVASFMALGFSLIGIGWVYKRQLRSRPAVE